jgi:hypothetical protein
MGHSSESCFNPGLILTIGKESRFFLFNGGGGGGSERLNHACRTARATPVKTHTRKKNRAAKMSSSSVFTVEGRGGEIGGSEAGDEAIRLAMFLQMRAYVV